MNSLTRPRCARRKRKLDWRSRCSPIAGTPLTPAGPESNTVEPLPEPQQLLLEDIDVHPDGRVAHQHVDSVFYGAAETRDVEPAPGETPAEAWEWVGPTELRENTDRYEPDVIELGIEAIDRVGSS